MTTQTLEAIPEETAAPVAAPTTPDRVTSDVPKAKPATAKNPGRVASGRRLAERNRLAREAKKNKPKHKSQLKARQQPMQQITPEVQQNNQAATTQTQATFCLGLSPVWACTINVRLS